MKKRIYSALALALALMMVLGACGNGDTASSQTSEPPLPGTSSPTDGSTPEASGDATAAELDQKIIWAVHNEADTLDPGVSNNTFASPVLMNLFEGLMTYDENNNLVEGVAESYTVSEDGTEYTFILRDGLKWSDGSDLTAEDFIYSWTRVITPETASNFVTLITDYVYNSKEFYNGEVGIEEVGFSATDSKTITIKTYAPTPYFLDILSTYTWCPVKKDVVEQNPTAWARDAATYVCNGPFKPSSLGIGTGYVLVKNEHYYDADRVKLQEINMRLIPENTTALTAFESGEIDGFYEVPSDDIPRLKMESDEMHSVAQFGTTYFLFNTGKAPLDDVNVRKALSLAIDRQQLIDNVAQAPYFPASSIVGPGYMVDGKDYTDGRPDYEITPNANIEKAKEYLAAAGYPDGEGFPALNLSYYTDANVKKYTEAIAQMWVDNLGIEVNITTEEWKVYYDGVQAHNYDVCAMGWGADYLYPTTFLETLIGDSINNNTQYANAQYDALVREAMGTTDLIKGAALMRQAEDILGQDMPIIPVFYRSRILMMKDSVQGWFLTPTNNMYFKYAEEVAA